MFCQKMKWNSKFTWSIKTKSWKAWVLREFLVKYLFKNECITDRWAAHLFISSNWFSEWSFQLFIANLRVPRLPWRLQPVLASTRLRWKTSGWYASEQDFFITSLSSLRVLAPLEMFDAANIWLGIGGFWLVSGMGDRSKGTDSNLAVPTCLQGPALIYFFFLFLIITTKYYRSN